MHPSISLKLTLAALIMPTLAFAEKKPTVVIVHKMHDGTNWRKVAEDLNQDGYVVITAALSESSTPASTRKDLQSALAGEPGRRILLVSTEAGSETVDVFASPKAAPIAGVAYLTGGGTPPISAVISPFPVYVIHLGSTRNFSLQHEAGLTVYTVPSTHAVARATDLAYTIDRVARATTAPESAALHQPLPGDLIENAGLR